MALRNRKKEIETERQSFCMRAHALVTQESARGVCETADPHTSAGSKDPERARERERTQASALCTALSGRYICTTPPPPPPHGAHSLAATAAGGRDDRQSERESTCIKAPSAIATSHGLMCVCMCVGFNAFITDDFWDERLLFLFYFITLTATENREISTSNFYFFIVIFTYSG